jgi:hypothetical protein
MNARRTVLECAVTLVTIAMRLSPIERDLLAGCLVLAFGRFLSPDEQVDDVHAGLREARGDSARR